jgi:hypothetical protein
MTWAKVDDQFPFHRKSIAVGPLGRDLYVAGLCYAKRERTDGFIPGYVVKHLAPGNASPAIVPKLVAAGYWHPVDGGFQIHDYLAHNDSAEVIEQRDQEKRARQRRWAEKLRIANSRREGDAAADAAPTRRETTHRDRDPDRDTTPPVSPPGFQEFYARYPRKKAPAAATRAWRSAVQKAPEGEILAALLRQLPELTRRPADRVPYPATWLNGEHWRNEPDDAHSEDPYAAWPTLYDCAKCRSAHETAACPRDP